METIDPVYLEVFRALWAVLSRVLCLMFTLDWYLIYIRINTDGLIFVSAKHTPHHKDNSLS